MNNVTDEITFYVDQFYTFVVFYWVIYKTKTPAFEMISNLIFVEKSQ